MFLIMDDDRIPEPPAGTPMRGSVVHRNITNIPDVWRHYNPERADRMEPSPEVVLPVGVN